jgi:AcrR family transcriptional regulator
MTARSAKAEATRQRICESVMQLYRERSIDDFTLDDIASRAGTTVQTVLRAYRSKDNVIIEALDRLTKQGSEYVADRPGGFMPSPPGDIAAAVTAIFDVYETVGNLVMRHLSNEERNPALKPVLTQGRVNHRAWVRAVFAPQLKVRGGNARAQLFNCLVVATDIYTWAILRRDQGLSRSGAETVVQTMVAAVTGRENANGTHSLAKLVGRRQPAA